MFIGHGYLARRSLRANGRPGFEPDPSFKGGFESQTLNYKNGSPGLVVIGGDSCSEGFVFESQHRILNGQYSHSIFVVKIVMNV